MTIKQEKDQLEIQLKRLLSIGFQSRSLEYLQQLLLIREDFFINAYWYQLVHTCVDAMIEYQTEDLTEEFLLRFIEKKKLLAGPLLAYKEFLNQEVEKLSLNRFKLEIDIYIEEMSKYLFKRSIYKSLQNWEDSTYSSLKTLVLKDVGIIDTYRGTGSLPEGNINQDMVDVLINVESGKALTDRGVFSGFSHIDSATGGFIPGDLAFVLAYTSQGKSTMLLNIAYNCMLNGGNCVYFVNELQYRQVKVKFMARHTANPSFWGGQLNGVATKSIEEGVLSASEIKVVKRAAKDIRNNKKYGRIYVVQLSSGSSLSAIEAKLTSLQASFPVDLVVIDDLRLCVGDLKGDEKSVLSKIIVAAKKLAVNFNQGKGVPILSPWQTKQVSFEEAKNKGKYPINSASDTNEVEKQADVMIWLLQTDDLKRKHQLLSGITKNRMGGTADSFVLMENWSYSYMSELSGVAVDVGANTSVDIKSSEEFRFLLEEALNID